MRLGAGLGEHEVHLLNDAGLANLIGDPKLDGLFAFLQVGEGDDLVDQHAGDTHQGDQEKSRKSSSFHTCLL